MDEKTNAEAVPEQRSSTELIQAAPVVSGETTTAFDPSTSVDATSAGQVPASALPATEAEQPAPIVDKSLSFLQPGTQPGSLGRLGHYEVLELLGKGAFGIVFKGLDEKLQRLVAIKVLGPQLARNATARSRFVREARAAAAVNSKHVVSTYEVNEQPIPYLVMEYVAGKTLQDRLDQTGALETRDILRIGAEIAAGLAAAHQQGLIHRDVKPANILLETPHPPTPSPTQGRGGAVGDRVRIADFGLARAVDDSSLTQSGVIAGTPLFMSPEQACGETLDHRSDLFSLGSVLYVMCTGQTPFQAHRTLGVLKRVCDDTPRPIREINAAIPDSLAATVNMLLVKDPAGRFQTAAAVADLLEQHLAHLDDPALPSPSGTLVGEATTDHLPAVSAQVNAVPSPKTKARRWWTWAAAAAFLLPVLALTLTETAGVTQLFQGGRALTDPNEPGSEPAPLLANQEPPPLAEQEKPIEKEPPAGLAGSEEHPFKKAQEGDWADYKMTTNAVNGQNLVGKIRIEVTARTEKTAKIRTVITLLGQEMASPEQEIDLTKPYDPANTASIPRGADAKVEKVDSGKEKIKVGDKEYETSWTKMKVKTKANGLDVEALTKSWTSRSAPLGGLVKMEMTNLMKRGAQTTESKTTMEFRASGHTLSPREARSFAARGDWNAAAAAYARIFAVQPLEDGEHGFEYAAVLLLSGDQPGYRKMCAEMLQRSGQRGVRPYHVARACTLAADSVKDAALGGQRAADELKRNNGTFWSLTEQGALLYRAGRYDEAATLLERSLQADSKPGRAVLNWLWLSLVEQRRGKPAEARAWLEKATKWLAQNPSSPVAADEAKGLHLHNWLEAQVLRREAERSLALEKRFPALLRGEDRPTENAERLAFAQLAYDHKNFALATRLWAEALASDPKLGDDRQRQHRYNAARAAALDAAGQGQDELPPDDAAKAKLRRQALDFLKADLTAWGKLLESGPPQARPTIVQALSHWRQDIALAVVRDAEALAKLPEAEQKEWRTFWAEVEVAFARVEALARQADEYLALALAHQRRGEKDKARRLLRQAVAVIKPVGDNAFVRELVREALREFGPDAPEAEVLLAAAAGEPPAALTQAIQKQPDQAAFYLARGDWYGCRGLWRKAADDFAAAHRLQPQAFTGMKLGVLLARIGEADRYRDHCKALVDRFAGTTNNYEADQTLKPCCLLGPVPVGDSARLARLAEVLVSGDNSQPVHVWFNLVRGMYEYRTGRFDAALATCRANRKRIQAQQGQDAALPAAVRAVEALALHRSGDTEGARRLLAEAKKRIDEKFLVLIGDGQVAQWYDLLVAELLYREAESLLNKAEETPK